MGTEAENPCPHAGRVFERPLQPIRIDAGVTCAADDAQDHHARAVRAGCGHADAAITLGGNEACHERAVAWPPSTLALWRGNGVVVDEIPSMDIVHVTVAVVVNFGLTVGFGLVGPQPIAYGGMIDRGAVVEHGDGHGVL